MGCNFGNWELSLNVTRFAIPKKVNKGGVMAGETANIADVAKMVFKDIFKIFKWVDVGCYDENFLCHKEKEHSGKTSGKGFKYEHPSDCVFYYFDPYKNQRIYHQVDLKSYAAKTITKDKIYEAIFSLAKTIDCARGSKPWQDKYIHGSVSHSVRGMLFIYNHDGEFDKDFYGHLNQVKMDKIPLKKGQIIHVIDPLRIKYLCSVVADIKHLSYENEIPKDYSFFYPDLFLHKSSGDDDSYPATVELLTAPYMILKFNNFGFEKDGEYIKNSSGYVVYYNKDGSTHNEFMYLLDSLSRFQLINSKETIKIRVAHHSPSENLMANYKRAKETYLEDWGLDEFKRVCLDRIEFGLVQNSIPNYSPGFLAWRCL